MIRVLKCQKIKLIRLVLSFKRRQIKFLFLWMTCFVGFYKRYSPGDIETTGILSFNLQDMIGLVCQGFIVRLLKTAEELKKQVNKKIFS